MILSPPPARLQNGLTTIALAEAGGITQFGFHLQSLAPGAQSSTPHWHSAEDEMAYLLDGRLTLIEPETETEIAPGTAVCFRHGHALPHALRNPGRRPCRFVMIGARAAGDVCTYADGARQINAETTWRVESPFGETLRHGALPPHLRDLAPAWGAPGKGPRVIRPVTTEAHETHHPHLPSFGPYQFQLLSDPGGLTQFGAFVEILPEGSASGPRHWHEEEDEMVLILEGTPTLCEAEETRLEPGMVLAWPKGAGPAHALRNDGPGVARYLVVGTRAERDRIHQPDHDLLTEKRGPLRRYCHSDGRPRA
jgi:uncharacterized cupin superfamily protein